MPIARQHMQGKVWLIAGATGFRDIPSEKGYSRFACQLWDISERLTGQKPN